MCEVKGYYAALAQIEQYATQDISVTEKAIQTLHALVMSEGRTRVKPTPYRDGNGRIARLLTTLILHLSGYGLQGLYSLEEHYAKNLLRYYRAISVGSSHNYYFGRAESDITDWQG